MAWIKKENEMKMHNKEEYHHTKQTDKKPVTSVWKDTVIVRVSVYVGFYCPWKLTATQPYLFLILENRLNIRYLY